MKPTAKPKLSLTDLKDEVNLIKKRYPTFKDDSAFVFWFLCANLVDKEDIAKSCLTGKEGGREGEKNIDAVYIDEKREQCNIIQAKFHDSPDFNEKRNDILTFADLAFKPYEDRSNLEAFYAKLDPIALEKFKEVVKCVKTKDYALNLYYVTTGTCTNTIVDEAKSKVQHAKGTADIFVIAHKDVILLLREYLDDITPHVPPLRLKVVSEGVIQHEGSIHRFDPKTEIESWVVSACGLDIAKMYSEVGPRLFAKNIRGYLGDTEINKSISETIKNHPDNFWYYNNGVTIVCSDAKKEQRGGEDFMVIDGAQIINGQQTTIALDAADENKTEKTNLLVRIIKIPRDANEEDYDKLINSIVRATNYQNYISPSDLVSNDSVQIHLRREFRKIGYQYINKRMSKREARKEFGQGYWQIDKREMAQAVGNCLLDPYVVRVGREGLFENPYYESLFSSRSIPFYLPKWWLMRQVKYVARGYSERTSAGGVVLNFVWKQMEKYIGSGKSEKNFRYSCEQGINEVMLPLQKAIISIFLAALKFYRLNRGEGAKKKTPNDFFKQPNLNVKFETFWQSNRNPYHSKFENYLKKFKKNLDEIEMD